MIIIEYDYYHFLKTTSKLAIFDKDISAQKNRSYHILAPKHIQMEDAPLKMATYYPIIQNIDQAPTEFSKIALSLLDYIKKHNITDVTFYTFPLIWLYLLPELNSLKIRISKFQPKSFLPEKLITSLFPFYYEHSLEYLKNFKYKTESDSFYEHHLTEQENLDSFIIVSSSQKIRQDVLDKRQFIPHSDIVIFNDNINYPRPLSSLKDQDISLYLYNPLLTRSDTFLIKKSLFNSLTTDELNLMENDPNYFFYEKNLNILVSLTIIENDTSKEINKNLSYNFSFEKIFIKFSKNLYLDFQRNKE